MTNPDSLAESLRLIPVGRADGSRPSLSGASVPGRSPARPKPSGPSVLAVAPTAPSSLPSLAFRADGPALQVIYTESSEDGGGSVRIVATAPLGDPPSTRASNLAASPDGRLVAAALDNGSLVCYDVVKTSSGGTMELRRRWEVKDAHSHGGTSIAGDDDDEAPSRYETAASESGPVRSLEFASQGHLLLLADGGRGDLAVYDAASERPANIIGGITGGAAAGIGWAAGGTFVTSACWLPPRPGGSGGLSLAVGGSDGTITVARLDGSSLTVLCGSLPHLFLSAEDDDTLSPSWTCTHLQALDRDGTVLAGFCRIVLTEEDLDGGDGRGREIFDENEEEDDPAEHETRLLVGTVSFDNEGENPTAAWTELDDLAPHFTVPRGGRHAFMTSYARLPSLQSHGGVGGGDIGLLFITSNLCSDIGVACRIGDEWTGIDLQEGNGAGCPTTEDDEFTFPTGMVVLAAATSGSDHRAVLLLAATDGSVSAFQLGHRDNAAFGKAQVSSEAQAMQEVVTAKPAAAIPAVHAKVEASAAETGATTLAPTLSSGFSFGVTPSFGSGSGGGLAFGSPSVLGGSKPPHTGMKVGEGKLSFGSTGTPAFGGGSAAPAFGSPSALGGFGVKAPAPVFESPSAPGGLGAKTLATEMASAFGGGSKAKGEKKETASGKGVFGSGALAPVFGSGASAPSFGSAIESTSGAWSGSSTGGGFGALAKSTTAGTGGFGALAKSTTAGTGGFGALANSAGMSPEWDGFGSSAGFSSVFNGGSASGSPTKGVMVGRHDSSMVKPLFGGPTQASPPALVATTSSTLAASKEEEGSKGGDKVKYELAPVPALSTAPMPSKLGELRASVRDEEDGTDDEASNTSSKALSLDTVEREEMEEEREDERQRSQEVFSSVAGGEESIDKADFKKLMEAMGTTYCEEEHRRTVRKLAGDDETICRDAFVEWYVDWLFGEGENESEDEYSEDESKEGKTGPALPSSATKGWGNAFKSAMAPLGSWKCDVCMVQNGPEQKKCAACETVRPGHEAEAEAEGKVAGLGSSSIGTGGFKFGNAITSIEGKATGIGSLSMGAEKIHIRKCCYFK